MTTTLYNALSLYAYVSITKEVILYVVIGEQPDDDIFTVCCRWIPDMNDLSIIRLLKANIIDSIIVGYISRCQTHMTMLLGDNVRTIEEWESKETTAMINKFIKE
jgi:hypothetical protein